MLREAVLPTPPFLVSAEAEVRAGNLSIATDHLESLIARSPKRLADYLEEARASYTG
jgi:NAD(P)H dehydrogenase (quinone)